MEASARRPLKEPDFERMNLPREFWRAKVSGVQESVRHTVERYLLRIREMREKGIGLFVHGESGVGKTSVAALAAKEARARGYTVLFVGVWELREMMRSHVMFEENISIQDRCRDVDFLVLDALGPEDADETWVNARFLSDLVNYRRSYRRVTIITSRVSPEDLRVSMKNVFDSTLGALVPLKVVGENLKFQHHGELVREVFGDR